MPDGATLHVQDIRADLAPQDLLVFTRDGAAAGKRLAREYQTRREAGLDVSWLNARALMREAAVAGHGGLLERGIGILHSPPWSELYTAIRLPAEFLCPPSVA